MDCREAHHLLNRGVAPGSATAQRAALGFHLARCPACREYRASTRALLAALLKQPAHAPSRRHRPVWWLRGVGVGMGAALVLLALLVARPAVLALITIRQNVQAMMVPTAAIAQAARPPAMPRATPAGGMAVTPAPAASASPSPQATAGPNPVPTNTPAPLLIALPQDGQAITVLLVGIDRRPDEGGPSRADAIVVGRIEPSRQRVALLSLPRDLLVDIPGYGQGRINAAMVYGEQSGQPGGGAALVRQTVSRLLGVPIDYTVQVDFQGFIGVIDAIGGIDITVPTELYDPAYPTMDYGYTVAHFLPGPQHMDGATALMYSRIRHMDSDFQRLQRQQTVMVGVLERLRKYNVLEQVQSIAAITTALRGYVQTDMPEAQIVGLAWAMRHIEPAAVERYALDGHGVAMHVVPDDPYAEVALPGAIESLVQQWLGAGTH